MEWLINTVGTKRVHILKLLAPTLLPCVVPQHSSSLMSAWDPWLLHASLEIGTHI